MDRAFIQMQWCAMTAMWHRSDPTAWMTMVAHHHIEDEMSGAECVARPSKGFLGYPE